MALHRDIYWVGKQWTVTGFGMQACDQKQKGKFDIEASRIWEDGVLDDMRAQKWLNSEDFDKAIAAARKYYPEPPRKAAPAPVAPAPPARSTKTKDQPEQGPRPRALDFAMRAESCRARFLPVWRVKMRRKR